MAAATTLRLSLLVGGALSASLACGGNDEPEPDPEPSGGDATMPFGGGRAGATQSGGAGGSSTSGGADSGGSGGTTATPVGGSSTGGTDTGFIECLTQADCEPFGGGKVCCDAGDIGFCTKPGACPGATRP